MCASFDDYYVDCISGTYYVLSINSKFKSEIYKGIQDILSFLLLRDILAKDDNSNICIVLILMQIWKNPNAIAFFEGLLAHQGGIKSQFSSNY